MGDQNVTVNIGETVPLTMHFQVRDKANHYAAMYMDLQKIIDRMVLRDHEEAIVEHTTLIGMEMCMSAQQEYEQNLKYQEQ